MAYKMIQVGTGGFGKHWCFDILPAKVSEGELEVVAAVDVDPDALENARTGLGLPPDRCFTDVAAAFGQVDADFCTIVVPPAHHEAIVDAALAHDLHILSEKPIADSLDASVRIADKVHRHGKLMGVTMSHSFDRDKVSFRAVVTDHQPLDYIVARVTNNARRFGVWGRYRHEMADPLVNETAYHHLDTIRAVANARCETVYAQTWTPPWGEYAGHSQGLVTMRFENGVRAMYEGAMSNAAGLNGSPTMYLRAECRDFTIVLDHRQIRKIPHDPSMAFRPVRECEGVPVPLMDRPTWGHSWLIDQFLAQLEGSEPMESDVASNLQTAAIVFSAIKSSHSNQPVAVQEELAAAWERVSRQRPETTYS